MPPGAIDPWRTSAILSDAEALELANLIELRGAAPDEIEARAAYLALLNPKPGDRALDVGCGSGVVSRDLARRGADVTGIDPQPALLAIAKRLAAEAKLSITFEHGDALELPTNAGAYDVVVCTTVLEHMPDAARAIPELVRALRRGGRLGVYCGDQESFAINHPDWALTRRIVSTFAEVRFANPWIGRAVPGLLEHAGLSNVQVKGFSTTSRDANSFLGRAAQLRADIALQAGVIDAKEHARWLAQLAERPFFAAVTYLFAWGTAAH